MDADDCAEAQRQRTAAANPTPAHSALRRHCQRKEPSQGPANIKSGSSWNSRRTRRFHLLTGRRSRRDRRRPPCQRTTRATENCNFDINAIRARTGYICRPGHADTSEVETEPTTTQAVLRLLQIRAALRMPPVEDHPATTAVHRKARSIQSTDSSTTLCRRAEAHPTARGTHNKRPVVVPVFYTAHLKDPTTQYQTVYLHLAFN